MTLYVLLGGTIERYMSNNGICSSLFYWVATIRFLVSYLWSLTVNVNDELFKIWVAVKWTFWAIFIY